RTFPPQPDHALVLGELLANINPPRRPRSNPRTIKRIISRYLIKKPEHHGTPAPPRTPTLIPPAS
ncbi:hypothetical protein, partial [Streptomyces sp. NPDC005046]